MLTFEPFSLAALQGVLPFLKANPSLCSDLSAGYLYMWHEGLDVWFCVWNGTFSVRQIIGEQPAFSYPFGKDPDGMLDLLIAYALENHLPLRFFAVDEPTLDRIRRDPRLQPALWACDRRWSDYIYLAQDAMSFAGKKFSGQRNHVNRFRNLYGEPVIRFLTPDDRKAVSDLLSEYRKEHRDGPALERMERERAEKLFDVCEPLGLYTVGLFVEGTLAAFSIGEVVRDRLLIHVEKALTRYDGIYPTVYSGFVRLMEQTLGTPLALVNREDDSGDPGLRISKTQYHPVFMAHKYLVHAGSPAARMDPPSFPVSDRLVLTGIRETDKAAYFELNTDLENNVYWGYDYREDASLPNPVDENTFYDSVRYDMQAGDSINFAIRTSAEGEMIGEAVLWNFSSDGFAELGCRILPRYQGNGYGKEAFGLVAAFAAQTLHLHVWARCFRENIPSFRMITGSGFTQICERPDMLYFRYLSGQEPDPGTCRTASGTGCA